MRHHLGMLSIALAGCSAGVIDIGPGECPFLFLDATAIDFVDAPIGERAVRELVVQNFCEGGVDALVATLSQP